MERISAKLQEENQAELETFKEGLVDKIDSYLNYVVENWMTENQLAVEQGLRTEIAEDFIRGMKSLFKEHYVEVPEEKYDVMAELQSKSDDLQSKLDESMTQAIELAKEVEKLKADRVVQEESKGLADTEVEKFKRLVEGIDFESEELYREKLTVVRKTISQQIDKL
jgi:putative heme iron utilization protein